MTRSARPRPERLIPRPLVPAAIAILGLAGAAVAGLGLAFAHQSAPGGLDRPLDHWLIRHLGARPLVPTLADLGNTGPVSVVTIGLTLALLWLRRPRAALLAATAAAGSTALTEGVVKPLVDRRYDATFRAFPSGHAAAVFALAFVAVVLVARAVWPRPVRILVTVVVLAVAAGSAAALVARRFHYTTDTLGGAGLALVFVLGLAVSIDGAADRIRRRAGRAADVDRPRAG